MFTEQGILRKENVLAFPGRHRAKRAIYLVEPLVLRTEEAYGVDLEEHRSVFARARDLFGLPPPQIRHKKKDATDGGGGGKEEL